MLVITQTVLCFVLTLGLAVILVTFFKGLSTQDSHLLAVKVKFFEHYVNALHWNLSILFLIGSMKMRTIQELPRLSKALSCPGA